MRETIISDNEGRTLGKNSIESHIAQLIAFETLAELARNQYYLRNDIKDEVFKNIISAAKNIFEEERCLKTN